MKKKRIKRIKGRLDKKFIRGLAVLAITLVVAVGLVLAYRMESVLISDYEYVYFGCTRYMASRIDGDLIDDYLKTRKIDDYYMGILEEMRQMHQEFGFEYFYVIVPGEDEVTYVWETTDDPENTLGQTELIHEDSKDVIEKTFRKDYVEEFGMYRDNAWQVMITAATPVFDSNGEPVALVCIDADAVGIYVEVARTIANVLVVAAIILITSIILYYFLINHTIITPVKQLTKGASLILPNIEKEEVFESGIRTGDEIEELAKSIEDIDVQLRDYINTNTRITAEKERIGAELDMAASIQLSQLPGKFPAFPDRTDFDIYASMTPAKEVGGDFYDFYMTDDDHIVLVIADVSGKGIPAALFMMISRILIKNCMQQGMSPSETLYKVNNQLLETDTDDMFVTVWLCVVELSTGKCVSANGGHEDPAICREGDGYTLDKYPHSPPVATMEDIPYKEREFRLSPGDSICVYTDGVTEATNSDEELLGEERMLVAMNRSKDLSPEETIASIRKAIDIFVDGAEQFDDITILTFKYYGPQQKE